MLWEALPDFFFLLWLSLALGFGEECPISSAICLEKESNFFNTWHGGKLQPAAPLLKQRACVLRTGGRQAEHRPARRPALRVAERRPAPRRALRRERCERENARAAGPAGDLLISDIAQFPATSATASASSRASLL